MKQSFALISAMVLAGCGGSSTPSTVDVLPERANLGDLPVNVTYDNATDTYTLERAGFGPTVLTPSTIYTFGTFEGAFGEPSAGQIFFAQISETDDSSAIVFTREDSSGGFSSATVARLTDTVMPTQGTATLTGDYVGLVKIAGDGEVRAVIIGEAAVDVDFGDATLSGTVINRELREFGSPSSILIGITSDNLMLGETTIAAADGSFAGATSGGRFIEDAGFLTEELLTVPDGNYTGLIAGPDGTEAVIAVRMTFSDASDNFEEVGAIAAGH